MLFVLLLDAAVQHCVEFIPVMWIFAVVQKICHLIEVPVTELTKAFLRPRIRVGREYVTKAQTKEQVTYCLPSCHTVDLVKIYWSTKI